MMPIVDNIGTINVTFKFGTKACADCDGTGEYVGFMKTDICRTCGGSGEVTTCSSIQNQLVEHNVTTPRAKRAISWDEVKKQIPAAYDHNLTFVFAPWLSDPSVTHQSDEACVWFNSERWLLSIVGTGLSYCSGSSLAWRWEPNTSQWNMIDASQV